MWYTKLESTGISSTVAHHTTSQEMAGSKRPFHQVRQQRKGKYSYSMWYSDSSDVQVTQTPKVKSNYQ